MQHDKFNLIAYRPKQAANAIGVCETTLYTHIKEGRIKARKIGHSTFITADELRRFIEAGDDARGQATDKFRQLRGLRKTVGSNAR